MRLLRKLWQFVNMDIFGRDEVLESTDAHFGKMTYFGTKGGAGHWEAELLLPDSPERIGIVIPAGKDAPLGPYAELAARLTRDLDALFDRCKEPLAVEWAQWCKGPFPSRWRESFLLVGVTLPENADENGEWDVSFFVEPANHYFTALFQDGKVSEVIVDG